MVRTLGRLCWNAAFANVVEAAQGTQWGLGTTDYRYSGKYTVPLSISHRQSRVEWFAKRYDLIAGVKWTMDTLDLPKMDNVYGCFGDC